MAARAYTAGEFPRADLSAAPTVTTSDKNQDFQNQIGVVTRTARILKLRRGTHMSRRGRLHVLLVLGSAGLLGACAGESQTPLSLGIIETASTSNPGDRTSASAPKAHQRRPQLTLAGQVLADLAIQRVTGRSSIPIGKP